MLNYPAQLAAIATQIRRAEDGSLLAALLINVLPEPARIHGWYYNFYHETRRDAAFYHYAESERHLKCAEQNDPRERIKRIREYQKLHRKI